MEFVIQWLWYLAAFAVGSLVAWLFAVVAIKTTTSERPAAGNDEPGAP
jgi:uncharacterized membrane protein ArfB